MKCKAVLDREGNVIVVSYVQPEKDEEGHILETGAMIEEERGQREVEIDVPEDYRKMHAPEFVQRVQADIKARREARAEA